MFKIIKKTPAVWQHELNGQIIHLSSFGVVADISLQTFILRALNGSYFPQQSVGIADIIVIDETDASVEETFGTINELLNRLVVLNYTPYIDANGISMDLQQVTDNGQTTSNPIVVEDIDGKNTYYSFGLQHTSDDVNVQALDFETPTTTETILIPNESGTMATREWVQDNPVSIDLQQVLDNGNLISNDTPIIYDDNGISQSFYSNGDVSFINTSNLHTNSFGILGLRHQTNNISNFTEIGFETPTGNRTLVFPNESGTLATQNWVDTGLATKINFNSWVNFSSTSTIVGFSSISVRNIRYIVIGDLCTILVNIIGTSNSTGFTYTLPFANTGGLLWIPIKIQNGGGFPAALGYADLPAGSSTVTLWATVQQGNWANTNTKGCHYMFSYKIN
jgi:hypothetical protein